MNEQRNFIIATVLSVLVLLGWEAFMPSRMTLFQQEAGAPLAPSTAPVSTMAPAPGSSADVTPSRATAHTMTSPAANAPAVDANLSRAQALARSPHIAIDTPSLKGGINLVGARIDDLELLRYRQDLAASAPPVSLLSPSGTSQAYFAQFGWSGPGAPGPDTRWHADHDRLSPGQPVTLSWSNAHGQRFEIRFSVDEDYMFTITQTVINSGAEAVTAQPYGLVSRKGLSPDLDSWTMHVGALGGFDGVLHNVNNEDITATGASGVHFSSRGGWAGFTDKYWLTALIGAENVPLQASFRHGAGDRYQADLQEQAQTVAPGAHVETKMHLFAGAKQVSLLDRYAEAYGISQFDKSIDWGWFYFLTKPIFYLLSWLYNLTGNFGVAIICLTLLMRVALFPVANKQFSSMARMRQIAPKMKALQERHKDDKPRLQKEVMALYRTEKVNPLSGCLPIFIQIPIFYALYKVLFLTIEIRHQPFFGWIHDLSAPDPLTPVNLFGLLPFVPPPFLAIGILPILLGLTMWLQQKLNPAPMDEIQAKVFGLMPWILIFIMAPFAAGLQLYWTTNNILSIIQQWWLYRRHGVE